MLQALRGLKSLWAAKKCRINRFAKKAAVRSTLPSQDDGIVKRNVIFSVAVFPVILREAVSFSFCTRLKIR
jgi:hypothetical protein